ncbi:MAG TPA: MFS transporter [Thermomicrobiales bacterium]|nr:MFS transporter [Thermomicrobiales bacterium]
MSATSRANGSPIRGIRKTQAVLLALVVLAFNLRAPILAVPPVLETIQRDLGLSGVAAGLITTLPVLCFGLVSPLAPVLARRLGLDTTLMLAMTAIATGVIVRMGQPALALYLGTLGLGTGIALLNVLIPAFVKREAPNRVGTMTSLYTMLLNAGAGVGSALTVPVMAATGWGWRPALGIWAIPAAIGIAVMVPWVLHQRRGAAGLRTLTRRRGLWNSPLAWQVTIAMGTQSMIFFSVAAWLPTLLQDAGMGEARSGAMLSVMTLSGLGGSFITPILANRTRSQSWLSPVTTTLLAGPLVALIVAPLWGTVLWVAMLGFGLGMIIALMLTLIILRAPDAQRASDLGGMAQGVGYLFASMGPIILGAIHDRTDGWTLPLIFCVALLVPYSINAWLAGRPRLVSAH